MKCPRCGFSEAEEPSCASCGVVFAKLAQRGERPRPPHPAPATASTPQPRGRVGAYLLAILVLGLGAAYLGRLSASHENDAPQPAPMPPSPSTDAAAGILPSAPEAPQMASRIPEPHRAESSAQTLSGAGSALESSAQTLSGAGSALENDVLRANQLTQRVNRGQPVTLQDLAEVEELRARNPGTPPLERLHQHVLVSLADQAQRSRRHAEADAYLLRAITVDPSQPQPWTRLTSLRIAAGDWKGAESAARSLLERFPDNADGLKNLGFALFRLDRNREAIAPLARVVELRGDPDAQALLARLRKSAQDESGMREQQLAHFNVRYDGDEHEAVGRAVLRVLERHYATLVRTLDHTPRSTIPVILFSRTAYYDASGAPAWSGGAYDRMDGRIRIPIAGLSASLTPDMDDTLIHEITHAFVYTMSGDLAPRDLHEGLAQYMEGKRLDQMLNREQRRALARGRVRGVSGFYIEALAFVEFLIGQRSMGGMKDLLEAMAETGDVDAAYERIHGRSQAEMTKAWRDHMRRRYGR